jgi:hypothetical protein
MKNQMKAGISSFSAHVAQCSLAMKDTSRRLPAQRDAHQRAQRIGGMFDIGIGQPENCGAPACAIP